MGAMKATLPDYPTVQYIGEPLDEKEIKMWAMTQALNHIKRGDDTPSLYIDRVGLFAQYLIRKLKKL